VVKVRQQVSTEGVAETDFAALMQHLPDAVDASQIAELVSACDLLQRASDREGIDPGDWAQQSDCVAAGIDTVYILSELHGPWDAAS